MCVMPCLSIILNIRVFCFFPGQEAMPDGLEINIVSGAPIHLLPDMAPLRDGWPYPHSFRRVWLTHRYQAKSYCLDVLYRARAHVLVHAQPRRAACVVVPPQMRRPPRRRNSLPGSGGLGEGLLAIGVVLDDEGAGVVGAEAAAALGRELGGELEAAGALDGLDGDLEVG